MADFQLTGRIEGIRFTDTSVFVTISEYRKGYRKGDGTTMPDTFFTWTVVYREGFKKYIASHFAKGMLVTVKGEIQPFRRRGDDFEDGYTALGQTMNLAAYHRDVRSERKMQAESQINITEAPNYKAYEQEDF